MYVALENKRLIECMKVKGTFQFEILSAICSNSQNFSNMLQYAVITEKEAIH